MSVVRHELDINPVPETERPMYVNEPWLTDLSLYEDGEQYREPEAEEDNIRVYIPMDINGASIIRRIEHTIGRYGEADEDNETNFSIEVDQILEQLGIYDQVWSAREYREGAKHSARAVEVAKAVIELLEDIPDGCAECFPYELIDELKEEYLSE